MRRLGPQTWELQAQGLSHEHLITHLRTHQILQLPNFDIQHHESLRSSNDKSKKGRSAPVQLTGPELALHKIPRALPQEENISQPPYVEKERRHIDLPSARQFSNMIGFLGEVGRDHINPLR